MKYLIKFKYVFLVLIFAFIASYPLLFPGLFPTHDGEYHVIRFYEFDKVLRSGVLYPRWAPDLNNGFGTPLFNYVYPLPNYFSSFFHLLGFSFIDSFKLNMFFASIFGAVFFFLFARKFWGNMGGLVGSVLYTFSPYHFVDIYIRGSVGEVWALALFPAFLWSITVFIKEKKNSFLFISSLFLALLIFSHNILALMSFVFSIIYAAILLLSEKKKRQLIIKIISIFIIGLFLSAVFWLPALYEKKYVIGLEIFNLKSNFPELFQLIFPSWGSGFSGNSLENQMSFQLGIANILVVLASIFFLFKKRKEYLIRLFFIVSFFVVSFLMLRLSYPIWANLPFMNYFQFPWRFLSLSIFTSSFLGASLFAQAKMKKIILGALLILFAVGLTYQYTKPAYYMNRDDQYYVTRSNFIDGTNSIGNSFNTIWFNSKNKKTNKLIEIDGSFKVLEKEVNKYKVSLSSENNSKTILNLAYFPGWSLFLDGKKIPTEPSKDGKIQFLSNKGKHLLEVSFENTTLEKISMALSISTFLLIFIWFLNLGYVKLKK